jgi:hypothetical protein
MEPVAEITLSLREQRQRTFQRDRLSRLMCFVMRYTGEVTQAIGPARLFGRVLCNVLADKSQSEFGTRMICVHPITLSVAQSPTKDDH